MYLLLYTLSNPPRFGSKKQNHSNLKNSFSGHLIGPVLAEFDDISSSHQLAAAQKCKFERFKFGRIQFRLKN